MTAPTPCMPGLRQSLDGSPPALVVVNLTPVPRTDYRIGMPSAQSWHERLNSDAADYGGSNLGNYGQVMAEPNPAHGFDNSIALTLPPLATLVLTPG